MAKARLDALADVDLGSRTARAVITAVDRLLAKAVAEAGGDTKQLQALPDKASPCAQLSAARVRTLFGGGARAGLSGHAPDTHTRATSPTG